MTRSFDIPPIYRSSSISALKQIRSENDRLKKDFQPSLLVAGKVHFRLARHFGFCFGVENAIERAYKALRENPDKRIFLISEMIHNAHVNDDLKKRGIKFIHSTDGSPLLSLDLLQPDDIVIIPAFGTTLEMIQSLEERKVNIQSYNTTCPFVERVWKRSVKLGSLGYTVLIHGHSGHEETKATFSHAKSAANALILHDKKEAHLLAGFMRRMAKIHKQQKAESLIGSQKDNLKRLEEDFFSSFEGRYSQGFCPEKDLSKIGVVNQTTILASETRSISSYLASVIIELYGAKNFREHFADTRDTLCYATLENQLSVQSLLEGQGDLAVIVGGYNSSNTFHLAEILQKKVPVYCIKDADEIQSRKKIHHLDLQTKKPRYTSDWLPDRENETVILISAGASCPDSLVEEVINRIAELYGEKSPLKDFILASNVG